MFNPSGIIIGLLMSAAGILFVKYGYQISNYTGPQDWIETVAGSGSTTGIYKLFGLILVILGVLTATGFGNNVLSFLLTPLKGVFPMLQN